MSKEIIKSIEINIGDTTVKVSPKQARELFQALADLLGENITKVTVTPSIPYYSPTWITPTPPTVTYGTGGVPLNNGGYTISGVSTDQVTTDTARFNPDVPYTLTIQ